MDKKWKHNLTNLLQTQPNDYKLPTLVQTPWTHMVGTLRNNQHKSGLHPNPTATSRGNQKQHRSRPKTGSKQTRQSNRPHTSKMHIHNTNLHAAVPPKCNTTTAPSHRQSEYVKHISYNGTKAKERIHEGPKTIRPTVGKQLALIYQHIAKQNLTNPNHHNQPRRSCSPSIHSTRRNNQHTQVQSLT